MHINSMSGTMPGNIGAGIYSYQQNMTNQVREESAAETAGAAEGLERKDVFIRSTPTESPESYTISMRDIWREMNIYTRLTEMLNNLTPEIEDGENGDTDVAYMQSESAA